MSWCDKLASTPIVGFQLDWHFAPSAAVLEAFSPILDRFVTGNKPRFSVDRQEAFVLIFMTEDGFQYSVDPSKISIGFFHRMKVRHISGGPPTMEMLSKPMPFTELLPEVSDKLIEAALLLPNSNKREINRVGIMAVTVVDLDEAPPGIIRFVDYMRRPWNGSAEYFNIQISADLGATSHWSDRCVHHLVRTEGQDQPLVTLQFDWQRKFTSGRPITRDSLKEIFTSAHKGALTYFEDLAEGSQFDEQLIRNSV